MTAWRGVQTYTLSRAATAIATCNGEPCGYSRRLGRGTAVLLGTWLAADAAPGRGGAILESQQVSSGSSNASMRAAAGALEPSASAPPPPRSSTAPPCPVASPRS